MNSPLISVIIPLYNKESWVERAIQSVLNQTYKNFELLIVNDGSTDGSLEKVKKFKDKRIRVFSKKNEGLSITRNFGIKYSKGDYIAFLDADDEWAEKELEYLIKGFSEETVLVCSDLKEIKSEAEKNNNDRRKLPFKINNKINYHNIEDYIKTLKEGYFILSGSSVLIKKDVIVDNNLYFYKEAEPAEDVNYWIRLSRFGKFRFCDYLGAFYYRVDENSIMNKKEDLPKLVPPFLLNVDFSQFKPEEIENLKKFIIKEYYKKAYQNRGKKFCKKELNQDLLIKKPDLKEKVIYLMIRFIPDFLFNLLKKGK